MAITAAMMGMGMSAAGIAAMVAASQQEQEANSSQYGGYRNTSYTGDGILTQNPNLANEAINRYRRFYATGIGVNSDTVQNATNDLTLQNRTPFQAPPTPTQLAEAMRQSYDTKWGSTVKDPNQGSRDPFSDNQQYNASVGGKVVAAGGGKQLAAAQAAAQPAAEQRPAWVTGGAGGVGYSTQQGYSPAGGMQGEMQQPMGPAGQQPMGPGGPQVPMYSDEGPSLRQQIYAQTLRAQNFQDQASQYQAPRFTREGMSMLDAYKPGQVSETAGRQVLDQNAQANLGAARSGGALGLRNALNANAQAGVNAEQSIAAQRAQEEQAYMGAKVNQANTDRTDYTQSQFGAQDRRLAAFGLGGNLAQGAIGQGETADISTAQIAAGRESNYLGQLGNLEANQQKVQTDTDTRNQNNEIRKNQNWFNMGGSLIAAGGKMMASGGGE